MNKNFFETVLNNIDTGICVIDTDDNILYYNHTFASIFNLNSYQGNIPYASLPFEYRNVSLLTQCKSTGRQLHRSVQINKNASASARISCINNPPEPSYYIEEINLDANASTVGKSSSLLRFPVDEVIISDKSMSDINETISKIAYFDSTVLIQGESGTGKTVLARHIHNSSNRAPKPFVTINCGSIPENLIESELFGYASGAFTSASKKGKPGQVELADGGTLFLDEIGLLPYNLQAKFLQLIQEKTYTPVGALNTKTVDVRIIAATNENLKEFIKEKKFREDLYYRLRVIELFVPPLRERKDAIEMLTKHFINKYNSKFGMNKSITAPAVNMLKEYSWPGNVRELQYVIERTIITSFKDVITTDDIPPLYDVKPAHSKQKYSIVLNDTKTFDEAIASFEKEILTDAFQKHGSSYKVAAALGMSQNKASRLLRKYEIR